MRPHQEIELKWALDQANHERLGLALTQMLGPPRHLDQRNRFFDAADRRLRKVGLNIRLRDENGRTLLTCKRRVAHNDAMHHHEEWEQWLDRTPEEIPDVTSLPLPEAWTTVLAGSAIELVGGFSNTRDEYHSGSELLCLDRTDFRNQRIEYELEIETTTTDATAKRWTRQLQEWGINFSPQPLSKFARLLALTPGGAMPPIAHRDQE